MTLREFLLAYRRRTGITQQELADRAGLSVRSLRNIEQGAVLRLHQRSKQRLAEAVGLSAAELDLLQRTGTAPDRPAAAPAVRIDVLGPLTIRVRGDLIELKPPAQRRLLGLLTLRAGEVVTHTEIVDFLWEEDIPASYLNLVHGHVSRLRRFLAAAGAGQELIGRSGAGYRLHLEAGQSDLLEFTALLARAAADRAAGRPEDARRGYEQALSLWRGQPLADLSAHTFQHPMVVALAQQRLTAALEYADLVLEHADPGPALERLHQVAAAEPLHEALNARILLALAASGQRAAALRLYDDLRDRLRTEFGIDPGPELRDARARVLCQDGPAPRDGTPAPALTPAATTAPAQLPPDLAAFTGRQEQIGVLNAYLSAPDAPPAAARVAVISGTAGVGKTSLAVHWGHHVRHHFPDGQLYYNLHGYSESAAKTPADALAGFLLALRVPPQTVPLDAEARSALFRSLTAERRMLLVLDNVTDPQQVRPLIPANRDSVVVVTSRHDLSGLKVHDDALMVELDVLDAEEAVALLRRALGPAAGDVPAHQLQQLARLCAYLPLALRIAAANISRGVYATVPEYITALREGDRLAELAIDGTASTAVQAAFELSYRALPASTARLFRLLGLVPGTDFSAEAAAALTGSSLARIRPELARLAGANLVDRVGPGRYRFHDLLRLYAAERAAAQESPRDAAEARQRLYDWYLLATRAAVERSHPHWGRLPLEPAPDGMPVPAFTDLAPAARWLATEHRNLVAAVHAAARSGPRRSAWLLIDTMRSHFWASGNMADWIPSARAAAAAAEAEGDLTGQAAATLALADAHAFQDRREALPLYEQALALARQGGWKAGASSIVNNLSGHHMRFGQVRDAVSFLLEGIALDEEDGRTAWLGVKHVNLAGAYAQLGRLADAFRHLATAAELHPDLDGILALNLGEVCHLRGDFQAALRYLEQARARSVQAMAPVVELPTLAVLAEVHAELGRYDTALALGQESLTRGRDLNDRHALSLAHNALGKLHRYTGHPRQALEHHQRAAEIAGDVHPAITGTALVGAATAAGALIRTDAGAGTGARTGSRAELGTRTGAGSGTGVGTGVGVGTGSRVEAGAEAVTFAERALRLARERSSRVLEGQAHTALATIALATGNRAEAARQARTALEIHRETGHRLGEAHTLHTLGEAVTGTAGAAHRRQAEQILRELGVHSVPRPGAEPGAQPSADSGVQPGAQPGAGSGAEPVAESGVQPDAQSGTESGAGTGVEPGAR
ncbi:BTAD domain-containing putative transcriptional regulator [Nonomuraea sp. NPDC050783]|uniref:BTAD domain-containing putative transcriptional regulator n=1 Tax=Nonomuraea sp. NPDC050783 TaxID=3154634 RepID=UPI003465ABEC